MTNGCRNCGRPRHVLPGTGKVLPTCLPCKTEEKRAWTEANAHKPCARCGTGTRTKSTTNCSDCHADMRMIREYGITLADYHAMLESQGNVCAICGTDKPGVNRGARFCIDHCHKTEEVRGLLCASCNQGLGLLGDSVEGLARAMRYLS